MHSGVHKLGGGEAEEEEAACFLSNGSLNHAAKNSFAPWPTDMDERYSEDSDDSDSEYGART